MINRKRTSLKPEVQDILNKQVQIEGNASQKYLAMAAWCEGKGLANSANYFYTQAEEERAHMIKIFKFIISMGGTPVTPSVAEPTQTYATIRDCFETALDSEIFVTQAINEIVAVSRNAIDYATEQLALWFVNEQIEEEYVARRALEVIDLMEGESLYTIDQELGNVREASPEGVTEEGEA